MFVIKLFNTYKTIHFLYQLWKSKSRSIFQLKSILRDKKKINDDETVFVLYTAKQIKLEPLESIIADIQIKVKLPHQTRGTISLLPSLSRQSLSTENETLIRGTCSDIKIELLNKNFSQNVIKKKNTEIAFIVILNKGNEKSYVKYKIT